MSNTYHYTVEINKGTGTGQFGWTGDLDADTIEGATDALLRNLRLNRETDSLTVWPRDFPNIKKVTGESAMSNTRTPEEWAAVRADALNGLVAYVKSLGYPHDHHSAYMVALDAVNMMTPDAERAPADGTLWEWEVWERDHGFTVAQGKVWATDREDAKEQADETIGEVCGTFLDSYAFFARPFEGVTA